ncbi:MAG: MFS transporter [Desulfobulbaceae bacterium]|nr:MFS transporter [Desulfobulbaceae bacterium]
MKHHHLIIVLLSTFISLLGIGIIVPIMPIIATTLGANGLTLGLIIAAFSISRTLLLPVVGNLSDRFGRKGFLICGLLIYSLVGLVFPQAQSISNIIAIRIFHGVGSAMIVPIAMAYVSDMSPIGQEGRYMGMLNVAIFSGIGCGPLLGGFFTDHWGVPAAFYAMSALSLLALLLVLLQMPGMEVKENRPQALGLFHSLRHMVKSRRTQGILLARMATMFIMVPTMAFLPLLMVKWFNSNGTQIGVVIACRTLANAICQTPFGRIAERRNKAWMLIIGSTVISTVMCLVPLAINYWLLLALFITLGIGEAIIWPTLGALAAEEGRHYGQGTMMGVFNMAMSAGILTGSVSAGLCTDLLGLRWSFFLIGIVVFGTTMFAARRILATDMMP